MSHPAALKRLHFIDVLRLIALAQMVNGHTLNALLSDGVRHGKGYDHYLWFRGLVSVAFMLVAGLSFHVTTVARFEQHRSDPSAMPRRVKRALEIIGIGLLLRFPFWTLGHFDRAHMRAALFGLSQIDVLPCIGVSLLVLEALVRVARRPGHVVIACAALASASVVAAPFAASLPHTGTIGWLAGWLGPQTGSPFPLLPWSGYIFAGVVLGAIALPLGARTQSPRAIFAFTLASLSLAALALVMERVPLSLAAPGAALVQPPAFFVEKLAAVSAAVAVLAFALRRVRALPAWLRILSGETLALYVFHLMVLYGFPYDLHGRIGESLSLRAAACVSTIMLAASISVGLGWHEWKRHREARRAGSARRPALATAFAAIAGMGLVLALASQVLAQGPINLNGTKYAIGGYDPVAYFEQKQAVRGQPQFHVEHDGAMWLFASAAHRDAYAARPEHFGPAYGGHCAYAAAQKRLVTIDPNAWSIVSERLYLNYSLEIRDKWSAGQAKFIRLADAYFAQLKH